MDKKEEESSLSLSFWVELFQKRKGSHKFGKDFAFIQIQRLISEIESEFLILPMLRSGLFWYGFLSLHSFFYDNSVLSLSWFKPDYHHWLLISRLSKNRPVGVEFFPEPPDDSRIKSKTDLSSLNKDLSLIRSASSEVWKAKRISAHLLNTFIPRFPSQWDLFN